MPQTGKGGMSMKNRPIQLSRQLRRVSIAMGYALARFYRLCYRIQFSGIGVSLIPGLLTCNISFRAGGSGRAHYLSSPIQRYNLSFSFAQNPWGKRGRILILDSNSTTCFGVLKEKELRRCHTKLQILDIYGRMQRAIGTGKVVNTALFALSNAPFGPYHRTTAVRLIGPKSPEEKDALLLDSVAALGEACA